jgi:molecular chaperone DnaK
MSYHLGIDLGTTYSAAATWRGDRPSMVSLGSRTATIPSVVLLREDGELLTGEAAERRAVVEPQRVAREFKRRMGDPTPVILGGAPYSAAALTARLLRAVVDAVVCFEGEAPTDIVVAHPANWGDYKQDLLFQAIHLAELDGVTTLTEPEAAAIHYAAQQRVAVGANVAVYDLGGGTFDAAVLCRDDTRWQCLGEPEGIEQLGGIDFDEAIFQHVKTVIGVETFDRLDPDDPPTRVGVARLRQECVQAKEALTFDTVVSIPVLLPTLQMEVRLTRAEFEDMIRPALTDSIAATKRAIRSAGLATDEVGTVLLVGGSSRIPMVAQMVEAEVGRPVAVDAHPKHVVALGSAITAAERSAGIPVPAAALTSVPSASASLADEVPPDLAGEGSLLPLLRMPSSEVTIPEPVPIPIAPWPGSPSRGARGSDGSSPSFDGSFVGTSYPEDEDADGVDDDLTVLGEGRAPRRPVGVLLASLAALGVLAAIAWFMLRTDGGGGTRAVDGTTPSTDAISGSETTPVDPADEDGVTTVSTPVESSTTAPGVSAPPTAPKEEHPSPTTATSPPTTQPTTTTTAPTTTTSSTTTTTTTTSTTTTGPG